MLQFVIYLYSYYFSGQLFGLHIDYCAMFVLLLATFANKATFEKLLISPCGIPTDFDSCNSMAYQCSII